MVRPIHEETGDSPNLPETPNTPEIMEIDKQVGANSSVHHGQKRTRSGWVLDQSAKMHQKESLDQNEKEAKSQRQIRSTQLHNEAKIKQETAAKINSQSGGKVEPNLYQPQRKVEKRTSSYLRTPAKSTQNDQLGFSPLAGMADNELERIPVGHVPYASGFGSRPIPTPSIVSGPINYFSSIFRQRPNDVERYLESREAELRHVRKQNKDLYKGYSSERESRIELAQFCNRLEDDIRQLRRQLKGALYARDQALDDREEALSGIKKAQEHAFTLLGDAEWEPKEDATIRRALNRLEKDCKEWSKRHAYPSLLTPVIMNAPAGTLQNWASLWGATFCNMDSAAWSSGLGSQEMDTKAPAMILLAWLLDVIYRDIISKPLFFIHRRQLSKDGFEETSEPFETAARKESHNANAFSASLGNERGVQEYWERLLSELETCNCSELHQWRAALLRQLYPRDSIIKATTTDSRKRTLNLTRMATQNAIDSVCEELAAKFHGEASLLIMGDSIEINKGLTAIFRIAAGLSTDLWTQKRRYELYPMQKLPPIYENNNDTLAAHPLHNGQLDEDSKAFHRKPILLVTHPALLAYGDSTGTEYSVPRVLKKAVVWMGITTE